MCWGCRCVERSRGIASIYRPSGRVHWNIQSRLTMRPPPTPVVLVLGSGAVLPLSLPRSRTSVLYLFLLGRVLLFLATSLPFARARLRKFRLRILRSPAFVLRITTLPSDSLSIPARILFFFFLFWRERRHHGLVILSLM